MAVTQGQFQRKCQIYVSLIWIWNISNFRLQTHLPGANQLKHNQIPPPHDDVIKWKHFSRNWPFVREIHQSPVNSPHKGQWRGALMFSFIYVWINGWVNNRQAGDLRRYRAHYEVTVMQPYSISGWSSNGTVVLTSYTSSMGALSWKSSHIGVFMAAGARMRKFMPYFSPHSSWKIILY